MRIFIAPVAFIFLNSCGAGVNGDVGKACMAAGRSAANSALCSCVQQSANHTLSGRDQKLAATFFEEPQKAQDVRQASGPVNNAFWDRYKIFTRQAEMSCR